jgi:hypothetical protein
MPTTSRRPPAVTFLLVALLAAADATANAQEPVPPPPAPPVPPTEPAAADATAVPPDGGEKDKGKKKKKKSAAEASDSDGSPAALAAAQAGEARIELRGRVFAASIYEDQRLERNLGTGRSDSERLTLTVASARFGVNVDINDLVSLQIEAELSGSRARIRDGYLQAKRKRWLVRGGNFKMPISVFTLESPWKLPLARRGILDDLLSEHLLLSGRREGVMAQVSGGGSWDPALTIGASRSLQWAPDAGDPLEELGPKDQTLTARLSVTPSGVEVAAVGQRRVTFVDRLRPYYAAGLESTGDFEFERTALRFWLEGMGGTSFLAYDTADTKVTFLTGRAMAAFRWGGLEQGTLYVEPFATVGMLDPDTTTTADRYLEVMAGVNVGQWRRTRLTLQFEMGQAPRNFPRNYFIGFFLPFVVNHRAAILQAGAAF